MKSEQKQVIQECAALSKSGQIDFGNVVGRLIRAGVERYHADYSRMEATYYAPDGSSLVVALELEVMPISETFSAAGVESAVRQAQRGEIKFPQFSSQATEAGCVGYFVQLSGKCVQYFGRNGEMHTEWFPGAK
ncbi:MAG: DUF1398 family protein [Phycisphaeraceae bacterium]|nr:DUF1398 family protein [Phycisphaeraceae bacterium]